MSVELWVGIGVLVGLMVVGVVYKLRGGPKGTYIASSVAVVLGGLSAILALGKRKKRPYAWAEGDKPPPPVEEVSSSVQPILDVAHADNDASRDEEYAAVEEALNGDSPEEDLTALGNSRRRRS